MIKMLKETVSGFYSLMVGMKITLKEFFKPSVTVQYPHQSLKMPARFRGHIELVRDPQTGKALCFACKVCEKSCPSDCIIVEGAKFEGDKRKSVTEFKLDFTKCSLCGSCVEACKGGAIQFSRQYNTVSLNKEDFVMNLFKKMEEEGALSSAPATALPASPSAAAPVVAGPDAAAPVKGGCKDCQECGAHKETP